MDSPHGGSEVTSSWLPHGNSEEDEGRYTVRSVARALRLMQLVADGPPGGRSLSDLARALGASKSTTLALARTLTSYGLLRDTRPGPKYMLGTALIRLGDIARGQLPLGEVCRPLLADLAGRTKMMARVAVSDGGHPVFIERADGPGSVRLRAPLGQREVPYACAAGKAILATMADADVRALCQQTGMRAWTARTITTEDALLQNLAVVRGRGFAVDDEEFTEGVFCVGAAFFGHDGSCAGAVSITALKEGDLPAWRLSEIGRMVRRTADQISAMLGGVSYAQRRKAAGA